MMATTDYVPVFLTPQGPSDPQAIYLGQGETVGVRVGGERKLPPNTFVIVDELHWTKSPEVLTGEDTPLFRGELGTFKGLTILRSDPVNIDVEQKLSVSNKPWYRQHSRKRY